MANYTTFIKGGHTDSQATNESTRSAKIYKDLNQYHLQKFVLLKSFYTIIF